MCQVYSDHRSILASFGYRIPILNKINDNSDLTYAKTNHTNDILFLQIVNKKFIPPIIYCLYYLETLKIIGTNSFSIAHFPKAIRYLSISHVLLPSNLDAINELFHLEYLEIKHTNLQIMPYIGSLQRLTFLILSYNNLTSLPISIQRTKCLKYLDVTKNLRLNSLDSLNDHQRIEKISADFCSIENLPKQLPQLQMLYMKNNTLKFLNNIETLGQNVNKSISFIFENNLIEQIPKEIIQIKQIGILNLNGNNIQNIQLKYLCELKNMTKLFIQRNPQRETEQPYTNQRLKICLRNTTIE